MINFSHAFTRKVFNFFYAIKISSKGSTHLKIYFCMQLTFSFARYYLIFLKYSTVKVFNFFMSIQQSSEELNLFHFFFKLFKSEIILHFKWSSLQNTCSHFSCSEWNEWKFFSILLKACTRIFRVSILPLAWLSWKKFISKPHEKDRKQKQMECKKARGVVECNWCTTK